MVDEYSAMIRNDTGDNVVNCIWLFKIKEAADRLKARLVANSANQVKCLIYHETFSPVIKPVSIRIVLSLAVTNGWKLHQIDIGNSFENGVLDERILMQQPPGFVDKAHPTQVCLLRKSIYSLKRSSCVWFHRLRDRLTTLGFVKIITDTSLFTYSFTRYDRDCDTPARLPSKRTRNLPRFRQSVLPQSQRQRPVVNRVN